MNCVRCGSELPKGATICSRCGCKNEMVEHSRIKEIIIFVMTMVSEFLILQNLLFILEDVKDYIKDIFKSAEFSFSRSEEHTSELQSLRLSRMPSSA